MDELIQKIEELTVVIGNDDTSMIISIVSIIVSVFIASITLIVTCFNHKQSKNLQKEIADNNDELLNIISNKQIKVQMHEDVLKIYDDFCTAENIVAFGYQNVAIITSDNNVYEGLPMPYKWQRDLYVSLNTVVQALNRARLIFPKEENELIENLTKIRDNIGTLHQQYSQYIYNNDLKAISNNAWQYVSTKYKIPINNYIVLGSNKNAFVEFIQLCEKDETRDMTQLVQETIVLFKDENFDNYFKKYLNLDI